MVLRLTRLVQLDHEFVTSDNYFNLRIGAVKEGYAAGVQKMLPSTILLLLLLMFDISGQYKLYGKI